MSPTNINDWNFYNKIQYYKNLANHVNQTLSILEKDMSALATELLNRLHAEKNTGVQITKIYFSQLLLDFYLRDQNFVMFSANANHSRVSYKFSTRPEFSYIVRKFDEETDYVQINMMRELNNKPGPDKSAYITEFPSLDNSDWFNDHYIIMKIFAMLSTKLSSLWMRFTSLNTPASQP